MKYLFSILCLGLLSFSLTGQIPWDNSGVFSDPDDSSYRLGKTAVGTQPGSAMLTVSNESAASPFLMFIDCHNDNGSRKALTVRDLTNNGPQDNFQIMATGQTYIGTSQYRFQMDNPGASYPWHAMLWVNGKIYTEELVVKHYGNWPDYVFSPDYELMSLGQLEDYITLHRHLPGLPSAEEIDQQQGIMTSEILKGTLEKVEELTLYLIKLNKQVELLQSENSILKKQWNSINN